MGESQYLSVIRIWAALAWADNVIAASEAAAMKRLITGAELSSDERATAMGWLDERVDLDTANIDGLGEAARKGIYKAAARLAVVDLDVADEEVTFLAKLRGALAISDADAREIEASVPELVGRS